MAKVDSYRPIPLHDETIPVQADIFQNVLPEAIGLRKNGALLKMGSKIQCPVVAFHGDYEPHPWAGVQKPLSQVLGDFRFILLNRCGHNPWNELYTKDRFY